MKMTYQSEVGKIDSVYIKRACDAFGNEENVRASWKELHYLDKPDYAKAMAEYEGFEGLLRSCDVKVETFPGDDTVTMDSMYCRDASIVTDGGVVICNMGKAARSHEPGAQERVYEERGIKVLGKIHSPGTVEGGDVAWLDDHTLAVGHSYRTNQDGIAQLTVLLAPLGVQVITVPLPHYKGMSDVFHLMSILSPVDRNLAVVYSPLMPIVFRHELVRRGYGFVEVPDDEFESMACNVLAVAPRKVIMVRGNPKTRDALIREGCQVLEYDGNEISFKGGGGPTCLTRPMLRSV